MSYTRPLLLAALALSVIGVLAGCDTSSPPQGKAPSAAPSAPHPAEPHSHAHPSTPPAKPDSAAPATSPAPAADPEVEKNLAKLSPEDQALARKQKKCPVTGEPLGSMGVPPKVQVKGRTVFLCCDGCEAALKKEPDKYLKKLDGG